MSRATKRKHVLHEAMQDDFAPPTEEQQIVCIANSRGNNLHEVTSSDNQSFLITMPTKFRKNIWVKRGDFVVVEPIKEGDKVKAEMVKVLSKEHIKYFKKIGVWPIQFSTQFDTNPSDDLEENLNNKVFSESESNSSDDSDTDSENELKQEEK